MAKMSGSLLNQLTLQQNFTFAEKGIADFINHNSDEVIHMDIATLAKATSSSNSTIIRMCRKLGFAGLREFRIQLIQELSGRNQKEVFVDFNVPFGENVGSREIADNMANLTKTAIDVCQQKLNMEVIEQAAELIYDSQHAFIYAMGDSLICAQSFANRMLKIGQYINLTSIIGEESFFSRNARSTDCAIIITYSAAFKKYIEYANILKENHVPIITLTANRHTGLVELSDYVIFIPELEKKGKRMGTFYSQVSLEYVLNVIYAIIYSFHYKENSTILGMF